ncbi:MAG TPA: hypothetical protein DCS43_14835 [Verrucomicrobia bacterium]|nr:hypothetical protein [Verrucomicrobiota bacterium]
MSMDFEIKADAARQSLSGAYKPPELRDACAQFEGLLLGMILKDGLSNPLGEGGEGDDEGGSGMDGFRDFCIEQVATTLSTSASLGLADQFSAPYVPPVKEVFNAGE